MSWFSTNWDKFIPIFLATIVAGLVGFFSAMLLVKNQISDLQTEFVKADGDLKAELILLDSKLKTNMAELKLEVSKVINPKLTTVDTHAQKISLIEKTIIVLTKDAEYLKGETQVLSSQTNSILLTNYQHGATATRPVLTQKSGR